jgi:cytidine deaminase
VDKIDVHDWSIRRNPRWFARFLWWFIRELFSAATKARLNAYAPYSGFAVGAAVRTDSGAIFSGANVENTAFPVGMCAEAAAIAAMVLAGERRIAEILVVAEGDALVTPCGAWNSPREAPRFM